MNSHRNSLKHIYSSWALPWNKTIIWVIQNCHPTLTNYVHIYITTLHWLKSHGDPSSVWVLFWATSTVTFSLAQKFEQACNWAKDCQKIWHKVLSQSIFAIRIKKYELYLHCIVKPASVSQTKASIDSARTFLSCLHTSQCWNPYNFHNPTFIVTLYKDLPAVVKKERWLSSIFSSNFSLLKLLDSTNTLNYKAS